jgi:hypothetical protein
MRPPISSLTPRAARTLYNVADALEPGLARDVTAALDGDDPGLGRLLAALEWRSRLRYGRGFSWQPRERRRALLEGWPGRVLRPRVEALLEAPGAQSRAEGA